MSSSRSLLAIFAVLSTAIAVVVVNAQGPLPQTIDVDIRDVASYQLLRTSGNSSLHRVIVGNQTAFHRPGLKMVQRPPYIDAPYVVKLSGSRKRIGYDYAALLANETAATLNTFIHHAMGDNATQLAAFFNFTDYLWDAFYLKHIPQRFLDELEGMEQWARENPDAAKHASPLPHVVSRRFFVLANMPADLPNIISALEREFERGWPAWLKDVVNLIISILEKLVHHCDALGVWGSRTVSGQIFTTRNLDYQSDTGIDQWKLVVIYDIRDETGSGMIDQPLSKIAAAATAARKQYTSIGFTFGLGALAGMSRNGISTSEMNLDNSRTTFSGLPFPLRLRLVLEEAHDLQSAMQTWNSTNNTNSFNFLIGSATDGAAYALETMYDFTAQFPSDSPVEAAATYDCGEPPFADPTCKKWIWGHQEPYGKIRIGFPLPEAVWRTNHGMNPTIMATQEPLFNDTIFRYRLQHDMIDGYGKSGPSAVGDYEAVRMVATAGIKGRHWFTCDQDLDYGSNVMSIVYALTTQQLYVAWERGSQATWRPAGCSQYVHIDLNEWW